MTQPTLFRTGEQRWPELARAAKEIAEKVCRDVNYRADNLKLSEPTPYAAQGLLEMVIRQLQASV
jgi:hypothetical protein